MDQPLDLNNAGDILLRGHDNGSTVGMLLSPLVQPITDLNADSVTDVHDLLIVLQSWGPCNDSNCPADVTGNGIVDIFDLLFVLANWG